MRCGSRWEHPELTPRPLLRQHGSGRASLRPTYPWGKGHRGRGRRGQCRPLRQARRASQDPASFMHPGEARARPPSYSAGVGVGAASPRCNRTAIPGPTPSSPQPHHCPSQTPPAAPRQPPSTSRSRPWRGATSDLSGRHTQSRRPGHEHPSGRSSTQHPPKQPAKDGANHKAVRK